LAHVNYLKQQDWCDVKVILKRNALDGATCWINKWTLQQNRASSHTALNTFIEPQQPRFKSGGLRLLEAPQEQVYHSRSWTTWTSWRRRSCWKPGEDVVSRSGWQI